MSEIVVSEVFRLSAARSVTNPKPVDIEALVHWAINQTGRLPWRGVSDRELAIDHGWTCIPKGVSREYRGGGVLLSRPVCDDGLAIVEAIKALDPQATAALVIACAREKVRPDWMPGVVPRLVPKRSYGKKRNGKRRGRSVVVNVWVPCDPAAIRAARQAYSRWHAGLSRLVDDLDGKLNGFSINGFAAPFEPWDVIHEKSA